MLPSSLFDGSSSDRISEIAALLATALTRMQSGKSSHKAVDRGESSLHILPNQCHSACNIDPLSRGIGVQN